MTVSCMGCPRCKICDEIGGTIVHGGPTTNLLTKYHSALVHLVMIRPNSTHRLLFNRAIQFFDQPSVV